MFPKVYRGTISETSRRGLIVGSKVLEKAGIFRDGMSSWIPDFAGRAPASLVIKTVSALGRAEIMIAASKGKMLPILLIRHPCGYVDSMLRGNRVGKMGTPPRLGRLLNTRAGKALFLGDENKLDPVENMAWGWLLANVEAKSAIERAGGLCVEYEKLTMSPLAEVRSLFEHAGVRWTTDTEQFINASGSKDSSYYSVYRRDATQQRWRSDLDSATAAKIREIAIRHELGRGFFDE
jgi:hypothetical protein